MKLAVGKIAIHTLVNAVKKLAVHPFKVHCQANRLPDADILKLCLAQIEHIALEVAGVAVFKCALDQLSRRERFAVVLTRPVA